MNAVEKKLPKLMVEELEAANMANPPFHSLHEGYAVLKEEIEEAQEMLHEVDACQEMLWAHTKRDSNKAFEYADRIERYAMRLAAEAIQVAAMARKFQEIKRRA